MSEIAKRIAESVVSYLAGKHIDPEHALMEVLPIADIIDAELSTTQSDCCWHCGVVLIPERLRCEDCPTECGEEGCNEMGCAATNTVEGRVMTESITPATKSQLQSDVRTLIAKLHEAYPITCAVAEDKDVEGLRQRLIGQVREAKDEGDTACSIWGDDGQGHARGFEGLPPCNCGALINFHKAENARLTAEVALLKSRQLCGDCNQPIEGTHYCFVCLCSEKEKARFAEEQTTKVRTALVEHVKAKAMDYDREAAKKGRAFSDKANVAYALASELETLEVE